MRPDKKLATMIRKFVSAVILISLLLVLVAWSVANTTVVTISFDPFSAADPAYAVRLRVFELCFVLVIAGVIIGGIAAWLRQAKWRRAARRLEAELKAARQDAERLRQQLAAREAAPRPLSLRPPAA
jgi:uncharacterized integral membrane protein